jgi:hypothetical protein
MGKYRKDTEKRVYLLMDGYRRYILRRTGGGKR